MSVAFLITALAVVAAPGTGALYTVSTGLGRGRRAAVIAAAGCTLGIVPHLVAAITGLAAVVHASAVAFSTLKWAGVAYLVYLAWLTWRDRTDLQAAADTKALPAWRIVRRAVLTNLLNPKLTVFFFAFLPQFVAADDPAAWRAMTGLGVVFMAMTFLVFAGYGLFASALRERVLTRPAVVQWMRRGFAAAYVGLAGRLAVAAR
ncbi:LysE family translocator [Demequina sp. TTPB684]|uniref:LysE family translocator n=1 Tax=unclassified Demequina TaxID=2620311 RepID=UPI001CF3FA18|nr:MULTISPECIES: LysE family translocator [unclassified Demequina]MCB2412016.1 LysE family translocator [Demequina sp. TTPB684]UPU88817.1 LysE family translocator [Demequina sp. TMPB413]